MSGPDLRNIPNDVLFNEVKRRFDCSFKPKGKVILTGPPGSGKGTQAPQLSQENCWCHLSTGDLLRDEVSRGTELGKKAKEIMNQGALVSDDIVIGMIKNKLKEPICSRGAIFDGFPRTVPQAEALDKMLEEEGSKIDKVVEFNIPDEILVERITGRRVHLASGRSYHVKFSPPKVPDVDDISGEPLIQRKDDTAEVLNKRLQAYHSTTTPILNYYSQKGLLATINANQPVKTVWEDLLRNISP
ncbi:unnamed protein product [Blepharisma stoltei]|uniref:Adenylate kinase active site lid domain-containing protein n=1 Tax=Blepharisma stoltei TaxID=1481888 RepID=A0AAU9JLA2_9CILI|nr:unnamed protein product [Blepharisma stoltei]